MRDTERAKHYRLNRFLLKESKRKCFACLKIKDLSEFHKNKNRYHSNCKSCENSLRLKNNTRSNLLLKQKELATKGLKLCRGCSEIKPLKEFKDNRKERNYNYRCRSCRIKYYKNYRKGKKEKDQFNLNL